MVFIATSTKPAVSGTTTGNKGKVSIRFHDIISIDLIDLMGKCNGVFGKFKFLQKNRDFWFELFKESGGV